ncbi:MAG: hypothetical protein ACRDP6_14720 [Actinoallomurus sp.]
MSDAQLPRPVGTTDFYLAAIHDRLGELLDRLPAAAPPEHTDGTVELREPKPPATSPGGEQREPAGGRGSPRPAPRRKPTPKNNT